jgi:membrane protease YdiL (CAAX protease family)
MSAITNCNTTDSKSLPLLLLHAALYAAPEMVLVGYSLFKINKAKENLLRISHHPSWMKRPFLRFGLGLGIGTAYGLANVLCSVLWSRLLWIPKMEGSPKLHAMMQEPDFLCLGGPVLEEICFRGCLLPVFIRAVGQPYGILGTSMLFGSFHLLEPEQEEDRILFSTHPQRIGQAVNATATGVLLGYISVYFGLLTAIGMHIGNNTSLYIIYKALKVTE